jgi:hypothetical protein
METYFTTHIIKLFCIFCSLSVLQTGCTKNDTTKLITIDVTKNYPEKKLFLQDIAEVEYLSLETDENYLSSFISGISESFVIGGNHVEKSFVFFDRKTGNPVSKISRYGNGPEEYNLPAASVYSEADDEFFILDYPTGIKVYGRDGTYKRKLLFREKSYIGAPEAFYNYDKENLLYYDGFQGSINDYPTAFVLVSKQDGHTTKEIEIPYEKKVSLMFTRKSDGQAIMGAMPKVHFAVPYGKDFLLTEYSTDTVFRFTPEQQLIPVLVREPSIQEMEPKVILHSWFETDKYLFFSTNKLEIDWNTPSEFPDKGLLMEKNTGNIYQANVVMKDYKDKSLILGPSILSRSLKDTKTGYMALPVSELMEANEAGKLSGKLNEIAGNLSENEDYIVMIMRFK